MITIHTVGGGCFRVTSFREVPTASRAFCSAEWLTDHGWIPGMGWIETITDDDRAIIIQVAHIDYMEWEVKQ